MCFQVLPGTKAGGDVIILCIQLTHDLKAALLFTPDLPEVWRTSYWVNPYCAHTGKLSLSTWQCPISSITPVWACPLAPLQSPGWSRYQLTLNLEQVAQANSSRKPLLWQSFFPATVVVNLPSKSNGYLGSKKISNKTPVSSFNTPTVPTCGTSLCALLPWILALCHGLSRFLWTDTHRYMPCLCLIPVPDLLPWADVCP